MNIISLVILAVLATMVVLVEIGLIMVNCFVFLRLGNRNLNANDDQREGLLTRSHRQFFKWFI
jgi:hypothetical protein